MKDTLLPSPVGPAGLRPAGRAFQEASALGWAPGVLASPCPPTPHAGVPQALWACPAQTPSSPPRCLQPLGRVAAAGPLLLAQPSTPGAERSQRCLGLKASREATALMQMKARFFFQNSWAHGASKEPGAREPIVSRGGSN